MGRCTSLVLALGLLGCNSERPRDIPCVDGKHWCEHGTVCTPDSKSCVGSVNWCADKDHWCTNDLMCSPDNKRCVTAIAYCPDKVRWCENGYVCTADSQRCWTPIQREDDTPVFLPLIINN